ncbi:hypothetical protein [Streptomyces canus]|uniref:hypothetical protein n=1 Tax=Streptomyces canus TaxID=58343 RepID=UPI00278A12FB|nr:hypothetical protein [Streptomyces canus]MDQ1072797.1 hypothetical protein [Streptomyces canus]
MHFVQRERDKTATGGRLPADAGPELDVMTADVAVMDAARQPDVRAEVIERVLALRLARDDLRAHLPGALDLAASGKAAPREGRLP